MLINSLKTQKFADRMDGQLEITLLDAIAINPCPEELTVKIKSVLASY